MILLVDGVWNTLKFQLAEGAYNQELTLETSFASLKMQDDKEELDNLLQNSRTVEDSEPNERRDSEYIDDSKTKNTMTVEGGYVSQKRLLLLWFLTCFVLVKMHSKVKFTAILLNSLQ